MIIRGKEKGESGVIKRVIRSQNRVIVDGKNLVNNPIIFLLICSSALIVLALKQYLVSFCVWHDASICFIV